MKAVILGKMKLDFMTNDEPSRHIFGTSVWYGVEKDNVEGCAVYKCFVSADKIAYKDIPINTEVDIGFDNKGKIYSIDMLL